MAEGELVKSEARSQRPEIGGQKRIKFAPIAFSFPTSEL